MCKLLQTSRGKYRIYGCLTNIFVTEQSLNYDIYLFKVVQYGHCVDNIQNYHVPYIMCKKKKKKGCKIAWFNFI